MEATLHLLNDSGGTETPSQSNESLSALQQSTASVMINVGVLERVACTRAEMTKRWEEWDHREHAPDSSDTAGPTSVLPSMVVWPTPPRAPPTPTADDLWWTQRSRTPRAQTAPGGARRRAVNGPQAPKARRPNAETPRSEFQVRISLDGSHSRQGSAKTRAPASPQVYSALRTTFRYHGRTPRSVSPEATEMRVNHNVWGRGAVVQH